MNDHVLAGALLAPFVLVALTAVGCVAYSHALGPAARRRRERAAAAAEVARLRLLWETAREVFPRLYGRACSDFRTFVRCQQSQELAQRGPAAWQDRDLDDSLVGAALAEVEAELQANRDAYEVRDVSVDRLDIRERGSHARRPGGPLDEVWP